MVWWQQTSRLSNCGLAAPCTLLQLAPISVPPPHEDALQSPGFLHIHPHCQLACLGLLFGRVIETPLLSRPFCELDISSRFQGLLLYN